MQAEAGVFNIPHFVEPDHFALGLEPEVTLSNGAGVGFNAKYSWGMNDLMNSQFIIGTGEGPRRFRLGSNVTFDFIPDIEGQPGIGIAVQALYVVLPNQGRLEVTGIPYIHKAFPQGEQDVEPFFAFPIGFGFSGGNYETIATAVIGSLFKRTEHLRFSMEFGVNVNHAETYFSGGILFNN